MKSDIINKKDSEQRKELNSAFNLTMLNNYICKKSVYPEPESLKKEKKLQISNLPNKRKHKPKQYHSPFSRGN